MGQIGVFIMYGVSKINIEPSLMMISVQDVEFKGNSLLPVLTLLLSFFLGRRSLPIPALWWI